MSHRVGYSPAEKSAFLEWDISTWSRAISLWERCLPRGDNLRGLELGGRRGGLSLYLASHGVQTLCTDIVNPEGIARPIHMQATCADAIQYAAVDALDIPFENHFDVVIFKSIIGGVGAVAGSAGQRRVFQQAHKALKPGGVLLFAENLKASSIHRFLRKRFVPWGQRWVYPTLADLRTWVQVFDDMELRTTGFLSAFGRSEWQRTVLATVDVVLVPLVSPSSRYVVFGAAHKTRP
jgi:SAM-dependent methyltransferase